LTWVGAPEFHARWAWNLPTPSNIQRNHARWAQNLRQFSTRWEENWSPPQLRAWRIPNCPKAFLRNYLGLTTVR
ncbi:MAG: hypothetical protein PHG65_11600, partial [Kiritimatiellae bacterium]|nr:hypothetical protein [Kiritimatiellia bacterium]